MIRKNLLVIFIMALIFQGCKIEDKYDKVVIEYYDYFDTFITLTYFGDPSKKEDVKKAVEERISYYHNLLTDFDEKGTVATINRQGKGEDKELVELTKRVLDDENMVGYTLDLSKGRLFRLWKDAILSEKLPSESDIRAANSNGGPGTVVVIDDEILLKDGAQLDYGSVCKGYLNDQLKEILADLKINNYILNSGGNITVKGRPAPDRNIYKIGIQSPFDLNDYVDTIEATDISVVTSGDYQRYAIIDGQRYHHIVDLKTGYPAHNQKRSITIIGPSAYLCDFLSTSLFLKDDSEINTMLKKYPGYYYYTVYEDQTFRCSDEIKSILGSGK